MGFGKYHVVLVLVVEAEGEGYEWRKQWGPQGQFRLAFHRRDTWIHCLWLQLAPCNLHGQTQSTVSSLALSLSLQMLLSFDHLLLSFFYCFGFSRHGRGTHLIDRKFNNLLCNCIDVLVLDWSVHSHTFFRKSNCQHAVQPYSNHEILTIQIIFLCWDLKIDADQRLWAFVSEWSSNERLTWAVNCPLDESIRV